MNEDLQNLADHVKARRDEKDWSQLDVYNRGGPSNSTLTAIEAARPPAPSRSTIRKLDIALDWEPGSTRDVLAGGEPTPIVPVDARVDVPKITAPPGTVRTSEDDVPTLLYRKPDELTDDEWRELIARTGPIVEWEIEQALRRRGQ
jgi:hypothetical protein